MSVIPGCSKLATAQPALETSLWNSQFKTGPPAAAFPKTDNDLSSSHRYRVVLITGLEPNSQKATRRSWDTEMIGNPDPPEPYGFGEAIRSFRPEALEEHPITNRSDDFLHFVGAFRDFGTTLSGGTRDLATKAAALSIAELARRNQLKDERRTRALLRASVAAAIAAFFTASGVAGNFLINAYRLEERTAENARLVKESTQLQKGFIEELSQRNKILMENVEELSKERWEDRETIRTLRREISILKTDGNSIPAEQNVPLPSRR